MNPFEVRRTLSNALSAALNGVEVLSAAPDAENLHSAAPWLLLDISYDRNVDPDDEFGTFDVYQHMTVTVTAYAADVERAEVLAEEVRVTLAGLTEDELDLGPGRMETPPVPSSNWRGLSVVFAQATYQQG